MTKTLRDEFAMAALAGMFVPVPLVSTHANDMAEGAYAIADAMMAERLKGQAEKPANDCVTAPDPRPAKCKFRLMDEGKPYPKSGCEVCQINLVRECPHLPPSWNSPPSFSHHRVVTP